ncbi:MAG: hypothetical protein LBV32_01425 [Tannerellaceae bacterium]|nr:hypothetical protein [Tannerellaceae bacterium]
MTKYNPNIHHRRSIRLHGYDYSQEGLYFVTICVQNRECLFGEIMDGEMILNEIGRIVKNEYQNNMDCLKLSVHSKHFLLEKSMNYVIQRVFPCGNVIITNT